MRSTVGPCATGWPERGSLQMGSGVRTARGPSLTEVTTLPVTCLRSHHTRSQSGRSHYGCSQPCGRAPWTSPGTKVSHVCSVSGTSL